MNRVVGGACLLALLACAFSAVTAFGNTVNTPKRAYIAPRYDVAKEITLQGVIESIVCKSTPGMLPGAHLMVSTPHGVVDAELGTFALRLPGASALAPGESVTLVGITASINHQNVLVTRLIQAGGKTIEIRTVSGFVVLPGARPHPAAARLFGGAR